MIRQFTEHRRVSRGVLCALAAALLCRTGAAAFPELNTPVHSTYAGLPLVFEPNAGQTDAGVQFLARADGHIVYLQTDGAVLSAPGLRPVRMTLAGARAPRQVRGVDPTGGVSNYLVGKDPTRWRTKIPHYRKVIYEAVYPGIDVVYRGNGRQLEYDFVVAPHADPAQIRVTFDGVSRIREAPDGSLVLQAGDGQLRQLRPRVYQSINGRETEVEARYSVRGMRVGFVLGPHDPSEPMVIDPVLAYSTYLGGAYTGGFGTIGNDVGKSIAVDGAGSAYVTGTTQSSGFPIRSALQPSLKGPSDAFVAKLNSDGSALVYSTFLGGSGDDVSAGIAVDAAGNAYMTGTTTSTDFPTVNPLQPLNHGLEDAFIAKLNSDGSAFFYASYLGGGHRDWGNAIALDSSGAIHVTGQTFSLNFPLSNASQTSPRGSADAFVAKIRPDGSGLVFSTYMGGSDSDGGGGIAVHSSGNVYVTGGTGSGNFPTVGPIQASRRGLSDAFVAKLSPSGATLYSTYLGGGHFDGGNGIAVDDAGNAYVAGFSSSGDFPTTAGAFQTAYRDGFADAFVAKLTSDGSNLAYSTYLGGGGRDDGHGIAVDSGGVAVVVGQTISGDFPTVQPLQGGGRGQFDVFVTRISPNGSALLFSTYLGGAEYDRGYAISLDRAGNMYLTGETNSPNFPTSTGIQPSISGANDAFVTKIWNFAPTISGQVTKAGVGLGGVAIALTGGPGGTTMTDTFGNYAFANLPPGGNYILTPTIANHVFTPPNATVNNLQADQSVNFTAAVLCTGSLVSSSANVGAAGGFGAFTLNIGAGCSWTAVSSQPWLEVSPSAGSGQRSLNWNASTNITLAQRSATIAVAGQTFTVTQAAVTCSFTLAEPATVVPHTGGSGTVALTASSANCAWTARSNKTWAQVSPISGTGSTAVSFTVFPNFNSTARTAQFTIAGQTYTIAQNLNPGTLNQRFVRLLYFSFLGRVPEEFEVNFHANSGLTRGQLAINFLRAEEFNIGGRFTAGLYVGLLNRDPEYGGWQFQRNALARGFTNHWTIIDNFINSAEYKGKFGTPTDVEYVRLLYRYVLLREAGPGEAEFHAGTIPQLGRSGVARSFLNSPEFRNGTQARLNAFLLFATLLLRDGSADELAFRRQQLQAGGDAALQSVIDAFVASAEMDNLLK